MTDRAAPLRGWFKALWIGFAIQVAGRLLDLQWHITHEGFETGRDQLQAHWLLWLGTVFVLVVAVRALGEGISQAERGGYLTVLVANLLHAGVSVVHFMQHLNHEEVDWAHILLAVTNVAGTVGVFIVTGARVSAARSSEAAPGT